MKNLVVILLLLVMASCETKQTKTAGKADMIEVADENPPMEGFNHEQSDPEAVMIADKVMTAMGGRRAWDQTRYLAWTFIDRRRLIWDKYTGDVRIEYLDRDETLLVNIHSLNGRASVDGREITSQDTLASYLSKAKSIWINDSYWLVMPFKLKDSGVSLYYIGSDTTEVGKDAYVLQLAFENVGDTPQNVYHVWVDQTSNLVTQWAYYESSENPHPDFITPWTEYKKYGDVLLSGERGIGKLSDIKVLDNVPKETFTSLEPVNNI